MKTGLAQAMWPFGMLPWEAFAALWSALNLAALVWMVGPFLEQALGRGAGPQAPPLVPASRPSAVRMRASALSSPGSGNSAPRCRTA